MPRIYREVHQTNIRGDHSVGRGDYALASGLNVIGRLVYIIGGIVVGLLSLRFLLAILGANPNNSFADFVYSATRPFAQPFFGLFNYKSQFGITRFEYETLIAIVVYALLTWLIGRLLGVNEDY